MQTPQNNVVSQQRCVGCLVEFEKTTNHPFLLCTRCEQRGHLLPLAEQIFQYRKSETARPQSERHGEMIRKMGQGRLQTTIEIFDCTNGEWSWKISSQTVAFAGASIQNSQVTQAMSEKKAGDQKALSQQRWRNRWRTIRTLVGVGATLGVAYLGFEQQWFVIDVDPFAVDQGTDMAVPTDMIAVLKEPVGTVPSTSDIEKGLGTRTQWDGIERTLRADLANNPRQGTELLQWLQVKALQYDPTTSEVPFPMEWLRFALSLHHEPNLGNRLQVIWHLTQGDLDSMRLRLRDCPEDKWCAGYHRALTGNIDSVQNDVELQLLAEYALSFAETDKWSVIADQMQEPNLTSLATLLRAEKAVHNQDWGMAKELVHNLQSSEYASLRLALWEQRLSKNAPQTVGQSKQMAIWNKGSIQTKGAWALEQAGAWLSSGQSNAGQEIEAWMTSDKWFEGDFPNLLLQNRFQLIRAQQHFYDGDLDTAIADLTTIQSSFADPLLAFWQGLLWIQLDRLRNTTVIAETLDVDTPHHWMLKVLIAIQSDNPKLLEQALDAIARTDIRLLYERTMMQTWVPAFNWSPLLKKAEGMITSTKVRSDYATVLAWLDGQNPSHYKHADGWGTGWLVCAQYAYAKQQYTPAHTCVNQFRALDSRSVAGELLSQLINIEIGRADIAKRELGLIAQRERSAAWGRWLALGFGKVNSIEEQQSAMERWYPPLPVRNISAEQHFLFDGLPHE